MKFKVGDTVEYDSEIYQIDTMSDNGEMCDIVNEDNHHIVWTKDLKLLVAKEVELKLDTDKLKNPLFTDGGIVKPTKYMEDVLYSGFGETKDMIDQYNNPKCECGAASLGYTTHMDYCPKVEM